MRGNDRTTKKENSIKEGERKQWINKKKKLTQEPEQENKENDNGKQNSARDKKKTLPINQP